MSIDKAGKSYWDHLWENSPSLSAVDPRVPGVNNYINWKFHEYFQKVFIGMETNGKRLVEIGCARSQWLPYFNKEFGFEVTGLDYSEAGCELARAILREQGIKGTVCCEDFFTPSKMLIEQFDVVISFGVLEHFEDTLGCISAFSRFLKPGGIMITSVPNMAGTIGHLQKIVYRPVFDIHALLDKDSLCKSHRDAGLNILDCDYFLSTNYGICSLTGLSTNTLSWWVKKIVLATLARSSMAVWFFESKVVEFRATRLFSGYINCLARKG